MIEVECSCEYPHGYDFEPPFETCTCEPDCFHIGLEAILAGENEEEEDFDPMSTDLSHDEGTMLG